MAKSKIIRIYDAYKTLKYDSAKDLIDDLVSVGYTELTHNSTAKKFTVEMEEKLKKAKKISKNMSAFAGISIKESEKKEKKKTSQKGKKKKTTAKKNTFNKKTKVKPVNKVEEEDDEEFEEIIIDKTSVVKEEVLEEEQQEDHAKEIEKEKKEGDTDSDDVKKKMESLRKEIREMEKKSSATDAYKQKRRTEKEYKKEPRGPQRDKIYIAAKKYGYSASSFRKILEQLGFTHLSNHSVFTEEMETAFHDHIEKEKAILRKKEEVKKETFNLSHKNSTVEEKEKKEKKKKKKKKRKAPKINEKDVEANLKKTLQMMEQGKKKKKYKKVVTEDIETEEEEIKIIKVPEFISVGELAELMDVDSTDIIRVAMDMGANVTINQRIDFENTQLLASEFGFEVELLPEYQMEENLISEYIEEFEESGIEKEMVTRAPVVTIMGHVDHGKTSILDYIRKTRVAEKEAGGITQSLGAYKVSTEHGDVVFLDTPGHEAFTAMRARGAQVTDIVIIVVAANDGVMPQTVEAINHAKAAGVPIVVAINKMDVPGANAEIIKSQLVKHNLLVEEYGGKVIAVPVSAKTGMGIDDLIETILLVASELDLSVPVNVPAKGTVLEAELNKKVGNVISLLVQEGTLSVGDTFFVGRTYGRVRALYDEWGKRVKTAGPSTPILLQGMNELPEVGDKLYVVGDEKKAKEIARKRMAAYKEQQMRRKEITLEMLSKQFMTMGRKELKLIIKGDKAGSVEAIADELEKHSTDKATVIIVHRATGVISENDVMLASASGAVIVGFNVQVDAKARALANKEKVEIRIYHIIYDVIDDVVKALEGLLDSQWEEVKKGEAEIRQVFSLPKGNKVAGCYVVEGNIHRNDLIKIVRDGEEIFNGKLYSLKRFKDDVKQVETGYECGMGFENFNDIQEGDRVIAYERVEKRPSLYDND